jgi:hypothetical protein
MLSIDNLEARRLLEAYVPLNFISPSQLIFAALTYSPSLLM